MTDFKQMYMCRLLTLISAALVLLVPASSLADYIPPGDVVVHTIAYVPQHKVLEAGTYHYSVSWQGIPVARAKVEVSGVAYINGKQFVYVKATAKTAKFIDIFYRLRHKTESVFSAESFRPLSFYSEQTENSKYKSRLVNFEPGGNVWTRERRKGRDDKEFEFFSDNPMFDPVSAAFLAKSLSLEMGAESSFDVFNGKNRFLITFTVKAREIININGVKRDAFKIEPVVKKLTDSKGKESRLHSASLWISADGKRDILKLESRVAVGRVSATLKRFEPALEPSTFDTKALRAKLRPKKEEPNTTLQ